MAKKFGWKQKKTIAMYINKRQWNEEFNPSFTDAVEIQAEQGGYLVRESSNAGAPIYIIAE
tara:strand:+ start:798 stop:980 length:183 start_codon:yes stop_codon:yes gene_type:complete